ncbi:RNA polymerase sigma factor [Flavimarina sp. Hel_I_48]|uniref:RNA polymerase sigma factor n=1 Tax=Flavimarina sp. Hel_I_48 TaxID=1392488 RepID=UPI0004DF555E|nr:sigma-70 family RNA polymerase sigma factor [Flavimarina sp. Hel_I_48]
MNQKDDNQLIETIRDGKTNAYAVLIERYERLVFSLALRMMKNREDAEEVAQDVFVKAYQSLNSFKGEAKFSSWLYRITYNRSLDMLARKKRQPTFENTETIVNLNLDAIENVLDAMERKTQQELIQQAINQLEADEAFVISIYYYQDQSVKEIAEITGLSESNVKIKLYRSRKKLFGLLERMPAFNKEEFL